MTLPKLPGATGITHLKVYDTPAPDGLVGGSAHVHFACTEAYMVVAGQGAVQTLSGQGFQETSLEPGKLVWFSPGVIHRLLNRDGQLEILVVMQNAGLPEAGDFVLVFPPETLADETAYFNAASLAAGTQVYAGSEAAAYRRRDLAVEGFLALRRQVEREGIDALKQFYAQAAKLIAPQLETWQHIWQRGPLAAAEQTGQHLEQLRQGQIDHLLAGQVAELPAPTESPRLGMCGRLTVYLPEGIRKLTADSR
jgi:mannose-6-phosphate isomerase-like protein (cupin superfamily)